MPTNNTNIGSNNTIWSEDSIINIISDSPSSQTGTISISGSRVTLGSLSSIEYTYDYGYEGTILRTNSLLIKCRASCSNSDLETRYNEYLAIEISIRYWKQDSDSETGYIEGNWSKLRVYPYFSSENEGYTIDIPADITLDYIDTIKIKILTGDLGTETVTVSLLDVYWEMSISEVINEYSGTAQIQRIDTYDDGLIGYYVDDEMPVTLHVEEISTGNYLIDVSGRYTFPLVIHSGPMPWDRTE